MAAKKVIAVDLGADSGRVLSVTYDSGSLHMEDVHRFPNIPVNAGGTLYWDALRLWHEVRQGVEMALPGASSIGIDTWGVDFALLDRNGKLVSNPVHYRDSRVEGMYDWVFARVPRREVFDRTGLQFMAFNTLFQVASMVRDNSPLLDATATYITIADLFNYWLGGHKACEYTHASTMQMLNPTTGGWDTDLLSRLGIPTGMLPEIVQPGAKIGAYKDVPLILSACHDTASAVVAVPALDEDFAYISSGTWSLMGTEERAPVINDLAYELNMTNEGGVNGTYRLLKNIAGMWLAQQSRYTWRDAGTDYSYDTLTQLATEAEPFRSLVDPDDASFIPPGDMPSRIRDFCRKTGQPVPETVGQVMRTIYESLALKYRLTFDKLLTLTGKHLRRVHIVGGGSRAALLCQMTADACNRQVVAGPVEATALGNAIVQLIALGEFGSVAQAREMLSRGTDMKTYTPKNVESWEEAYGRFKNLLTTN